MMALTRFRIAAVRPSFLWILMGSFAMIFLICGDAAAEQKLYRSGGKRDPFVPLVTTMTKSIAIVQVESLDNIRLEGLVYDPKKGSVAIVNGSLVREGERVGNIQLLEVRKDGALFLCNDKQVYKALYTEDAGGPSKTSQQKSVNPATPTKM